MKHYGEFKEQVRPTTTKTKDEEEECPECGETVYMEYTGNPTQGNTPEMRCPNCRVRF